VGLEKRSGVGTEGAERSGYALKGFHSLFRFVCCFGTSQSFIKRESGFPS
jgi:hypothetical protein